MATPNGMTSSELDELLHLHYISEKDQFDLAGAGAVYLTEVTAPGHSGRRADAVHIGLWSSRGAGTVEVCELKVSRADWLKELKEPKKAEAWWPYCNLFWLVVPHAGIVQEGELPKGWGLMMPSGGKSRRFKVLQKPEEKDSEITPGLLITLLKNTETTRTNALQQQERVLRQKFYDQEKQTQRQRGLFNEKDKRRLELLDRLEAALGVELTDYSWEEKLQPEGAARALKALAGGEAALDKTKDRAESAVRELDRAAKSAQETADRLRKEMGIR